MSRPSFEDIKDAYNNIRDKLHLTPVLRSSLIDKQSSENAGLTDEAIQLFFKCENFQKTGAFKARGACNAVLNQLKKNQGNFIKTISLN